MPKAAGELRENQSGYWDNSCDAKRSTFASQNRSQIWPLSDGSTSIPPDWVSVSTENRLQGSKLPEREPLSERETCPETKGEDCAQACSGCPTTNPFGDLFIMRDTNAMLSILTIIWHLLRKQISARKMALSSRQFMCQERNSPLQTLCTGLPSKTVPQPVIDVSIVIMWRWWVAPILTPLRRKVGPCHIKRVRTQLCDTMIRRVAGPVERILNSLIHQRNGLMWSNPRGSTGEAAAMRPRSLRQVLTETWWPSLKRAKHKLKLKIRTGARRACIWTESKWTPKNTVCWERVRTLFLVFVLRPRAWMWWRTISLW